MFKPVVLVPVYNHEHAIGAMVDAILAHPVPCLLVDDGSTPECATVLRDIAAANAGRLSLVRLPENRGKGGAIMAGFVEASRLGYTHALQIDADGQHDARCIPQFLTLAEAQPETVVCGYPIYDHSVPRLRLWARHLTHIWVWINSLSFTVRDSMCGLRVYPLPAVMALMHEARLGRRMEFDPEVMVRLVWRGVRVVNLPTPVTYPADGVSHFRAWRDNVLISGMHTRLFFGMLWRLPRLMARKLRFK